MTTMEEITQKFLDALAEKDGQIASQNANMLLFALIILLD